MAQLENLHPLPNLPTAPSEAVAPRLGMAQPRAGWQRTFDVLAGSALLAATAPLLLAIALLVRADSAGPVFFAQTRIGLGGARFRIYKFRKFRDGIGDSGPGLTLPADARLTRVGAWLERSKFDELPQLLNVLQGSMALVGPRPELPKFADLFAGADAELLRFKPGIFGPSQTVYAAESTLFGTGVAPEAAYRAAQFPRKAALDLAYYRDPSLVGHVRWIALGALSAVASLLRPPRARYAGAKPTVALCGATDGGRQLARWAAASGAANVVGYFGPETKTAAATDELPCLGSVDAWLADGKNLGIAELWAVAPLPASAAELARARGVRVVDLTAALAENA